MELITNDLNKYNFNDLLVLGRSLNCTNINCLATKIFTKYHNSNMEITKDSVPQLYKNLELEKQIDYVDKLTSQEKEIIKDYTNKEYNDLNDI